MQRLQSYHGEKMGRERNSNCLGFLVGILIIVSQIAFAQDFQQKLKTAQELQKTGYVSEAIQLYEQLYQLQPQNGAVFNGLRQLYIQSRDYDRALTLIEDRLLRFPNDISLEISTGQVFYRMGREKEAFEKWQDILSKKAKEIPIYQLVANAMVGERLLDEAIDVYLLGRKRIGKDDLFVFNLASLYGARMDFENATEELIRFLRTNPGHASTVESRLRQFPRTERVIRDITKQLKKAIDSAPDQPAYRQVLASVYLNSGHYDKAFKISLVLEQMDKEKKGQILYNYAQKVFLAGAPKQAEKAYNQILNSYPKSPWRDKTLFGLAQSYEAQDYFRKAVDSYDQVFNEFQKGPLAIQSLYNKALIQRDHLFDLAGAEQTFQTLLNRYPRSKEGQEGQLELAKCYIARGDLLKAETVYRKALERYQKTKEGLWLRTLVGLADVLFLMERFDETISQLDILSSTTLSPTLLQNPVLNDGLRLRLFVGEHTKRWAEELHFYVRSDLLKRERRYEEALMVLDSLIIQRSHTPLTAYGLFQKGEITLLQGKYRDSIAPFDSLQTRFPNSLIADQALERLGWIYEMMGKKQLALNQYEKLLVVYPHSFLADEIRARIRRLEEKNS